MAGGVEYTIDELAREAGTTVRSVRVYHERGVLPPPAVKGRTGFYSPQHLNRVRTISRLLDRGIKLNGIKELLAAWDRGDDLGDILGVEELAEPPAAAAAGETISATELSDRFGAVPSGLARVVAAGLYEPVDAATYRVADRELAYFADQLIGAGVPVAEVLTELEKLRTDCDRIARRVADLFGRTVWESFRQAERSSVGDAEFTERVELVRSAPGRTAADLVNRFVGRYLAEDPELAELLPGE
ncbi:MerR family transcriptional regulator [Nocardia stercoris]|uniref:MerR family transcriptional regulator n=1 Tax=Nocardia stercoris TaxID=2483361 RepID=A0A3M2KZ04_9NOCA|nr:MerR family transcriptional regulator [Nocardia stercoris]RMI29503.1 MerR family transcriptional regulator [Nocardia stercoris]